LALMVGIFWASMAAQRVSRRTLRQAFELLGSHTTPASVRIRFDFFDGRFETHLRGHDC
jgi:hypothetical protein